MTCPRLVDSGVYVLGALPPAQRLAYERHLADCAECRAEVGDLAVLPGLLGRLDEPSVTSVAAIDPAPPSVLAGALARVRHQRRVRRFTTGALAIAAAAVAVVAGIALPQVGAAPVAAPGTTAPVVSQSPSNTLSTRLVTHEMTPVGDPGAVTARVGLTPVADGTEIELTCWYGSESEVQYHGDSASFSLYVVPRGGGAAANVRNWTARPGDMAKLPAVTSLSISDVARLELRDASGKTLLEYTVT